MTKGTFMRTRDIDRSFSVITENIPGTIVNYDDDFVFSGYGYNDPVEKKRPTDGSYTITRGQRYVSGTFRLWEIYRPSGVVTQNKLWQGPLWQLPSGTNLQNQFIPFSDAQYARAYNGALDRMYAEMRSSDLNLAVSAGEYRESQRMLAGAARAIGSVIRSARKVRKLILTNPSLLLSSGWLAYTYGWKPLLRDIYAAADFHRKLIEDGFSARGRNRAVETQSTTTKDGWITTQTSKENSDRVEAKVWYGLSDSDTYNLSRMTSLDPLSIAWELMPLSFVVDWFVNVGGYLELLEASYGRGLIFKRGYITTTRRRTVKKQLYGANTAPRVVYDYWYGLLVYDRDDYCTASGEREDITKVRYSLGSFPRPIVPSFKVNMGAARTMSAAALIRTILLPKKI